MKKYKIKNFDATKEEWYVYQYLLELKKNNIVKKIDFQPTKFTLFKGEKRKFYSIKHLKTKTSKSYLKRKYLINPHIYTPDFKIYWNIEKNIDKFAQYQNRSELNKNISFFITLEASTVKKEILQVSYLEVKASFDQNNMTRMFTSHIQPLIWEKYETYIQLIKPMSLFKDTFIPNSLLSELFYSKSGKWGKKGDKKFKWEYRTFKEFINIKTKQF